MKRAAALILGVLFLSTALPAMAAGRVPLKEKFPQAGETISLIEGFPVLKTLLEMDDPWKGNPVRLKEELFPKEVALVQGSQETPLLFSGQRTKDWAGVPVWDQWVSETDYSVANPARPAIRLHLGRTSRGTVLVHSLDQAAVTQVSTNIKRIAEGLRPYGARQLPFTHPRIVKYLLPGGGTQTTFLMALDDRIGPASPSCYIMTRQRKFVQPGLADGCHHLADEGWHRIEHADYAMMRLPRPTQILAAEKDFFDIQATRTAADEIMRAYRTAGHPDRFELFVSDTPHGFTAPHRIAATRWMRRWLLEIKDEVSDADDLEVFPDKQLNVTHSGQVGRDFEDEVSVGELNLRRARELQSQRDAFRRDHSPEQAVDRIRRLLRIRDPLPKAATRRVAKLTHAGCRVEKLILRRADDVPLPALLVTPLDAKCPKLPATLIVDASGKSATIKRALRLAASGRVVLTVDLRGYGETRDTGSNAKYFNHEQYTGYLAMHIGRPLLGQRVEDLLAAVDALAALARVDTENMELLGIRSAGPVALHAAVLDRRITSLRMEQSIRSWIDGVVARPLERDLIGHVVPGALCWYDLPDLVELLKNR